MGTGTGHSSHIRSGAASAAKQNGEGKPSSSRRTVSVVFASFATRPCPCALDARISHACYAASRLVHVRHVAHPCARHQDSQHRHVSSGGAESSGGAVPCVSKLKPERASSAGATSAGLRAPASVAEGGVAVGCLKLASGVLSSLEVPMDVGTTASAFSKAGSSWLDEREGAARRPAWCPEMSTARAPSTVAVAGPAGSLRVPNASVVGRTCDCDGSGRARGVIKAARGGVGSSGGVSERDELMPHSEGGGLSDAGEQRADGVHASPDVLLGLLEILDDPAGDESGGTPASLLLLLLPYCASTPPMPGGNALIGAARASPEPAGSELKAPLVCDCFFLAADELVPPPVGVRRRDAEEVAAGAGAATLVNFLPGACGEEARSRLSRPAGFDGLLLRLAEPGGVLLFPEDAGREGAPLADDDGTEAAVVDRLAAPRDGLSMRFFRNKASRSTEGLLFPLWWAKAREPH